MTGKWPAGARMGDSTKAMRKSIGDRDILSAFENRQLNEITSDDLRARSAVRPPLQCTSATS
ncbi:hypothetical protein D3C87_2158680 [compost metagenome]